MLDRCTKLKNFNQKGPFALVACNDTEKEKERTRKLPSSAKNGDGKGGIDLHLDETQNN